MMTVVTLVAVLVSCCLPLLAHRTFELHTARCQARPGIAACTDSSTSASRLRRTQPAYSGVIDLHADHGGARHLSATLKRTNYISASNNTAVASVSQPNPLAFAPDTGSSARRHSRWESHNSSGWWTECEAVGDLWSARARLTA